MTPNFLLHLPVVMSCVATNCQEVSAATKNIWSPAIGKRTITIATFDRDMARVKQIERNSDISELSRFSNDLFDQWAPERDSKLPRLIAALCSRVATSFPASPDRNRLLSKWSVRVLSISARVELETELALSQYLVHKDAGSDSAWNKTTKEDERRRLARAILTVIARIEREAKDAWKPHTVFVNISSPGNSGISGMFVDDIEDPVLREKYRAALADNARKTSENLEQSLLKRAKKTWLPKAESKLAKLYCSDPANAAELRNLTIEFRVNDDVRKRILEKCTDKNRSMKNESVNPKH